MTHPQWPTVLVLASGRGERYLASGGRTHKLQALMGGKPVLAHTLDAVKATGLPWHVEQAAHPGMGDSIAAAVRATADANGWLILPGDLPLVQAASLLAVAVGLRTHAVVLPTIAKRRGHPVGFGPVCREALMSLHGDEGAASVVRRYLAYELPLADEGCVTDVDTVEALAQAQALLDKRLAGDHAAGDAGT